MADVKRNIYISINGKEVTNSLSGIRGAIRNTERDIRNLNRSDADYQKTLKDHQERLQALRNEYSRARAELGQAPTLFQKIKAELGDVAAGFLKAFTITAIIGTFIAGVKSAFNTIKEFDQAQADLAGILETNRLGIAKLTFAAMKLGATTSFTSTQVSNAQLELAKLGKSVQEIINMTPGVLNAAVAMDSDLAPAAELVAGQLNAFGAASSEAGKYADILSNSTNVSATSFESLSISLPKVSKVAAEAGVTFEKLNATIGVLADQNIAAETSGTSFRNILLTAAEKGVHYEELLKRVYNATDRLSVATELFGKQNAVVAVTLATSSEKIKQQTEALENSAGSAEKLAKERLNSLSGDMKLFDSAMEGFILSMENGDGWLVKATRSMVQFGTEFMNSITPMRKFSDELFDQQMGLNVLISRITSSNIKNEERISLLNELNEKYPEFIQNIDIETISNEQLIERLAEVNKNYRERLLLQMEVEKADKIRADRDDVAKRGLDLEIRLRERLLKVINENDWDMTVDFSNIEKSAREVMAKLKEEGKRTGWFSDYAGIESTLKKVEGFAHAESLVNDQLDEQILKIDEIKDKKNLQTEAEKAAADQAKKDLDEIYQKAIKLGGVAGIDFKENDIESIRKYVVAKQAEIAADKSASANRKELTEKELARLQRLADQKQRVFETGEKQIDQILLQSLQQRESRTLSGIVKEIKVVENKYAQLLLKYKDHRDRFKELEEAKDAEIAEIKRLKNTEYMLQQFEVEKAIEEEKEIWRLERQAENAQSEEERQLLLIDKARYIADLEIEAELEKELAKVEDVEMAEELKQAIRDKYAQRKAKNDENFDTAERQLKNKQVDWTKITEAQKLDIARNSLNMASEAFNEGSGAWKAAKIAETIVATYQSATNAFNALAGIPIVGPGLGTAAAALAVTAGLKNIQKITSTQIPKMPSYYYGGFTGISDGSLGGDQYGKFAGMTHEKEWVAPAFMTQNPRYANIISWLENERRYGVGSNPIPNEPSPNNEALIAATMAMIETVSNMNETLSAGITSKTYIGYKEMIKLNHLNADLQTSHQNANIK